MTQAPGLVSRWSLFPFSSCSPVFWLVVAETSHGAVREAWGPAGCPAASPGSVITALEGDRGNGAFLVPSVCCHPSLASTFP